MLQAAFDFPRHPLAREDGERLRGAWFEPPARWLRAQSADELAGVIDAAHAAARAGAWVLGGLRYEAAAALDGALAVHASGAPLAEFAIYEKPPQEWPAANAIGRLTSDWLDAQPDAAEHAQIERIREYIRAGDCYQVNLTTRLNAALTAEDPAELFLALHRSQPGGFSLFLRGDGEHGGAASVSPELFFDWRPLPEGPHTWLLAAQPMKGTAPRGDDRLADEAAQAYLRTSEKERAENLMIVDLLRNDLGRIAELGSVRVPRLFELHALPTVWQMTSTVSAVSRPGLTLAQAFGALFPCGSVTGAPKVRAMQIIRELEPGTRGWYCGALGLIQPGGVATFNVPIRTVEFRGNALSCGIGSAITLDSSPAGEVAEWRAKTRFLLRAQAPIAALETLRLSAGQYQRLEGHLARLQRTARHFGLRLSMGAVREALDANRVDGDWRVRLTAAQDGAVKIERYALPATPLRVQLALAAEPVPTQGPEAEFLHHKTTRREIYERLSAGKPTEAFDVILWITLDSSPAGEVAEWRAKTRFLLRAQAPIAALETLRLSAGQYQRLEGHLARLQRTARHFGLRLSMGAVREALDANRVDGDWRVRLTAAQDGAVKIERYALPATPLRVQLALAAEPVPTQGPEAEFLHHKTTRREIYERLSAGKPTEAFDVILWNETGELTECSFGNLALKIDGEWLTPRREAGLLPGIYREELLRAGRLREAKLMKSDLDRVEDLAFVNSLRGWVDADLMR